MPGPFPSYPAQTPEQTVTRDTVGTPVFTVIAAALAIWHQHAHLPDNTKPIDTIHASLSAALVVARIQYLSYAPSRAPGDYDTMTALRSAATAERHTAAILAHPRLHPLAIPVPRDHKTMHAVPLGTLDARAVLAPATTAEPVRQSSIAAVIPDLTDDPALPFEQLTLLAVSGRTIPDSYIHTSLWLDPDLETLLALLHDLYPDADQTIPLGRLPAVLRDIPHLQTRNHFPLETLNPRR